MLLVSATPPHFFLLFYQSDSCSLPGIRSLLYWYGRSRRSLGLAMRLVFISMSYRFPFVSHWMNRSWNALIQYSDNCFMEKVLEPRKQAFLLLLRRFMTQELGKDDLCRPHIVAIPSCAFRWMDRSQIHRYCTWLHLGQLVVPWRRFWLQDTPSDFVSRHRLDSMADLYNSDTCHSRTWTTPSTIV